jgi:hypothetical protein
MCDYSLQGLPNRLAEEGEQLVTYRFRTGSIGMASPTEIGVRPAPREQPAVQRSWWEAFKAWMAGPLESDDVCAVCVAPGTRLLMSHIPDRLRREFSLNMVEDVTFMQLSAEAFQFRDAIVFANGKELVLQSIPAGVMFQVLRTAPRDPAPANVTNTRETVPSEPVTALR